MSEKRNIVLITLDSVRADHCSFMGYHRKTTPTIDKMAREGLYFENAIAASVDTPQSMFSIFTGEYPLIEYDNRVPKVWEREFRYRKTLAETLLDIGYTTYGIHANPSLSRYAGYNKGFKYYEDFLQYQENFFHRILNKIFSLLGFSTLADCIIGCGPATNWEKIFKTLRELNVKASQPFFIWILLLDTHMPYLPPQKARRFSTLLEVLQTNWSVSREARKGKVFDRKWRDSLINVYDDCIASADNFIMLCWEYLQDSDPIFIIHADHGEGFYEHGFYGHYHPLLYEELIHVPLVIYNADVKGKVEEPVSLLGIAPTILELIGEKNEFPSKSFLRGGDDWVISKIFDGVKWRIAVRTKRWKFIRGQNEVDELYDLKEDPYEQENVVTNYPDLAKEMKKIVESHVKQEIERRKIRDILKIKKTLL